MDPVTLSILTTNILVRALPYIYDGGRAVVDKSVDMLLEKGIERVSSETIDRAKDLLDKINPKMSESLEKALKNTSKNSEDPKTKENLQLEILKLLTDNPDLAKEIEITIKLNVDKVDQLALGNYNNFFNFGTPSGDEYIKVIDYLDVKRKEAKNQKILSQYNPSTLPIYPKKLKQFVTENRADKLREALICLENHGILLISGIGGVGKTTLVRALVDLRPVNVPEPFWFSFYGNQDAQMGDILEKLASYLKAPEIAAFKFEKREPRKFDVDKLTDELQKVGQTWLIFDDLDSMLVDQRFSDKGIDVFFYSLRYNTHAAKIIITSRIMPKFENGQNLINIVEGEKKYDLDGLSTKYAVDYLVNNGLDNVDPEKLKELAKSVDGHPLALELVIELVNEYGVNETIGDLSMFEGRKEDIIKKARKLFEKLAGNEKELLERISVYREPVNINGLKIMFNKTTPKNTIDLLVNKSLLETDHNGNYWLHPLVKEFSYEDLENKKETHMLAYNYYSSLTIPETPTNKEDFKPAIEAHYHASEAGEYDLAAKVIYKSKLNIYLDTWGDYTTLLMLYRRVLPDDPLNNPINLSNEMKSFVFGNLGRTYRKLGNIKTAIEFSKRALDIAKEIGNRRREEEDLGNLGIAYRYLGEIEKSITFFEQALKISEEIGDRRGKGKNLGNLGNAYIDLGKPRKAIEYYEQSLQVARNIEDRHGEGSSLGNLGLVSIYLGELKKAIDYCKQALKIAKKTAYKHGEVNNLRNLGLAYFYLGEPRKAIECWEQAIKISEKVGYKRGEAINLGNIGSAYRYLGETNKAIELCEKALEISHEIGYRRGELNQLGTLGLAYNDMKETEKAIKYCEQALEIAKEIGDKRGEIDQLGTLGLVYINKGKPEKTIEYCKQALQISREIEYRFGEVDQLGTLGLAYNDMGEPNEAVTVFKQALKIAKEIDYKWGEGTYLGNMGNAYIKLGEPKKAIELLEISLAIGKDIEDPRIISFCEKKLKKLSLVND